MIDLVILTATAGASALVGGLIGFNIAGRLAGARVARFSTAYYDTVAELTQAQNRIHRALDQVTPGANATVARMARLLCGRQA